MIVGAQSTGLVDLLSKTVLYSDVALSPDASHVAWVQSTAGTTSKQTYVCGAAANSTANMLNLGDFGDRVDADPEWSPDSKTLAVFSTAGENDQRQLWLAGNGNSAPQKVTHLKGYAARPRWSHDGRQIAFLYIEEGGGGGPLLAAPATTGVIDTSIHNQRIAVLNVGTGQVHQASPPDLHVYDFDWSPDDKTFVATAAPGPGDNNWWIAQIYAIDPAKGAASSIYKPSLQVAVPRWSPDGKSIAFIEGIMSDEGFYGGDLFTISSTGTGLTNRTKSRKSSVTSIFWHAPDRIVFTEVVGGGSALSELTLTTNTTRTLWQGPEGIHAFGNFPNFALSGDGMTVAAERSTYDMPPEIWSGPIGQWRQLTQNNAAQSATWGKAVNLEWTNDGFKIQGWLLQPKEIDAKVKHPMVVLIHGGPSSAEMPAWPAGFGMWKAIIAALSSRGYYVLMPNPRGSYGQGEEFTRANVKDFGAGDLRDVMAGVDTAIAQHPIDPKRLGLTGWSYGGFMTMWTVTQTNRFHAAVAGAGIANWQSYYGQNLIDQWMIPFFGASVYDDPGIYEKSSPIRFVKNVKTPTLVIVGERDAECPTPQSYEFWHALTTLHVPTQLIVYPGEGHLFMNPENQRDRLDRVLAWFDKYLK
jgi:dipeptidyl aminopeptidase/acylaminoacyl peptidase